MRLPLFAQSKADPPTSPTGMHSPPMFQRSLLLHPQTSSCPTTIFIGEGLLHDEIPSHLAQIKGKVVIISDPTVQKLYAEELAQQTQSELLIINSHENRKTQATVDQIVEKLCEFHAGKDTTLVAIGGGVTTDLVGFTASIFKRGIPHILIPTTLLGCVDAAIGGKTGIDTHFGKNQLGTLYHPKAIFIDLNTLKTLPEKEIRNGMAEIIKIGLVLDSSIWEAMQNENNRSEIIYKAIEGKIAVIEKDPTEQGLRRILNFGHTIGHALESIANYSIAHGEAVALGCLIESYLSMQLGILPIDEFQRIQMIYRSFLLQLPASYSRVKLLEAISQDKKCLAGQGRFVLIDAIGHALPFDGAFCRPVTVNELEPTLEWMEVNFL